MTAETPLHPDGQAPEYVVRELHKTMHWAVATAVAVFISSGFQIRSIPHRLAESSVTGSEAEWRPIVVIAGAALLGAAAGWTGWRMLRWFSAILRLRGDATLTHAEEAFGRQRRLWISLTVLAGVRLLVQMLESLGLA